MSQETKHLLKQQEAVRGEFQTNPGPSAGAQCAVSGRVEDSRAKALRIVSTGIPGGLFCGFDRNRQTFFWPFLGTTVAGRWTEVNHQSPLSQRHHRSSAESSSNPQGVSRDVVVQLATQPLTLHSDVQEVHLTERHHDARQGPVLCSCSLMALLSLSAKKAGVFLRHVTIASMPCFRSPDISQPMLFLMSRPVIR